MKFLYWLFSLEPLEKTVLDPAEKLLNSMRVTARCRFNASVRLKRQSNFSFFYNDDTFAWSDIYTVGTKFRYSACV